MTSCTSTIAGQLRDLADKLEGEDQQEVPHMRGVSNAGDYGFEVPIGSDIHIEPRESDRNKWRAAWHSEDDKGDLEKRGLREAKKSGYDSYAVIDELSIV